MARKRKKQPTDIGTSEHEKDSKRTLSMTMHGNSRLSKHLKSTDMNLHSRMKASYRKMFGKDSTNC